MTITSTHTNPADAIAKATEGHPSDINITLSLQTVVSTSPTINSVVNVFLFWSLFTRVFVKYVIYFCFIVAFSYISANYVISVLLNVRYINYPE